MTAETYAERKRREAGVLDACHARGSRTARRLLRWFVESERAESKSARDLSATKFQAATQILCDEYGYTEHAFAVCVVTPYRLAVAGECPDQRQTIERAEWEAKMAEAIDAELAKLR